MGEMTTEYAVSLNGCVIYVCEDEADAVELAEDRTRAHGPDSCWAIAPVIRFAAARRNPYDALGGDAK